MSERHDNGIVPVIRNLRAFHKRGNAFERQETMRIFRPILIVTFATATVATATLAAATLAACDPHVPLGHVGDAGVSRLWTATFEPGDLSEWTADGKGGTMVANLTTKPVATTEMAHNGKYAGKATVKPSMGMVSIDYLYREQPSLTEGYYSAWFYIPGTFTVKTWLSIIHFVGSPSADGRNVFPTWDVNLYPQADGTLAAQLYDFVKQVNRQQPSAMAVPTSKWVHFELLLRKAADATGRIAVWQDGTPIFDVDGIPTSENGWAEWNVGGSSDEISPAPGYVYIDDAAISLTRLGPGG